MLKKITILLSSFMVFTICMAMNEQKINGTTEQEFEELFDDAYIQLGIKYFNPAHKIVELKSKEILLNEKLIDADGEIIDRDFVRKNYGKEIHKARFFKSLDGTDMGCSSDEEDSCLLQ